MLHPAINQNVAIALVYGTGLALLLGTVVVIVKATR